MGMAKLEFKTPGDLLDEIMLLRSALKAIDDIAVSKKAGAAKKMQEVARIALAHPNGHHQSEAT